MRSPPTRLLVAGVASGAIGLALACGGNDTPRAPSTRPAAPATRPAPAPPSFELHEWGLFGVDLDHAEVARAATGVAPTASPPEVSGLGGTIGLGNLGTIGGKPVIYLHLGEGTDEARVRVSLGLPRDRIAEHWPSAALEAETMHWDVVAKRGPCDAPTPTPVADSAFCRSVPDGFCEAPEIPRYRGRGASCLSVGEARSEVLFYRTAELDASSFPLRLEKRGRSYAVARAAGATTTGPVLYVERNGETIRIRELGEAEREGTIPSDDRTTTPRGARALLTREAIARGLSPEEAEAMVDAWAPAYFGRCLRGGPEATGNAPPAFAHVDRSLLYFAPPELVDRLLPLSTSPSASATKRVFLVRYVDGSRVTPVGELPPPTEPRARVSPGTLHVEGGLTSDWVRRVARRHIAEIRHCYEGALDRNPRAQGRVVVEASVQPTGDVASARVHESTSRDRELDECIAGAVRRWQFPAPEPAAPSTTRIPFELREEPL